MGVGADLKSSNRLLTNAGQGGLSIGQRDYYLSPDTSMRKIRDAFLGYAAKLFELHGESAADATSHAQTVLDIETKFAQASMDQVTQRNPSGCKPRMSIAQFETIAPHFKWQSFISAQGGPNVTEINVAQPEFFRALDGFITSIPIDDWKTLLRFRLLHSSAGSLPKRYADEGFAFAKLFTGQKERLPRWKSCGQRTTGVLGEAVGEIGILAIQRRRESAGAATVDNMVSRLNE